MNSIAAVPTESASEVKIAPVRIRIPLSASPDHLLLATPSQQTLLCLVQNDDVEALDQGAEPYILYVSESHLQDSGVQSYMGRLDHYGYDFRIEPVRVEVIAHMYSSSPKETGDLSQLSERQRLCMRIMEQAASKQASDVHLMLEERALQIKFRIHGDLESHSQLVRADGEALLNTIYSSMCGASDEFFKPNEPQDARMKKEYVKECGLFGARVATRPMMSGPLMVMRLLYDNGQVRKLEELGYLKEQITLLKRLIHQKKGIVIVSGVTGSGKSVSLQVLLQELLEHFERKIHLLTLEDPPEYVIAGANQTELGQGTWAEGITNAVRLDPDILMVGEIRDFDSAQAGVRGALTGHGLWTTLHTPDAISSIQRLLDLGVDPTLVLDPSLFKGLVNQSLTRVLCNDCKVPFAAGRHQLSPDLADRVQKFCTPASVYLRGPGCAHCHQKGITGRTVVAEVLIPNLQFMRVFRDKGKAEAKAYWVNSMGGITKTQHAIKLINSGIADPFMIEGDVGALDEDEVTIGSVSLEPAA